MAKRIVWTETARYERQRILDFWFYKTGNKKYSKELAQQFRERLRHISDYNYAGRKSIYPNTRETACGHFTLFYQLRDLEILVTGIFDTRRNPDDLHELLSR